MSELAGLQPGMQIVRRKGNDSIITRAHINLATGQPDGFEVVAPIRLFVAAGAYDICLPEEGWWRFPSHDGLAYVHNDAARVEELAAML